LARHYCGKPGTRTRSVLRNVQDQRTQSPDRLYVQSLESASIDLIAAIRAVGIVAIRRIAEAAETVVKFAMLMAAMETTEVSGHVAATEAAAKMTAAETATMAPTTAAASECGS